MVPIREFYGNVEAFLQEETKLKFKKIYGDRYKIGKPTFTIEIFI